MHHALHIEEILLCIFGHCCPAEPYWTAKRRRSTAALATLARTCRAFKDPALDALWSELIDFTPLPQCIPEACRVSGRLSFSFARQLSEAEWAVLWGYTRRVRHIRAHASPDGVMDSDSLMMICSTPIATQKPLFPNLRTFYWQGATTIPVMHISTPSLTTLDLDLGLEYIPTLQNTLETLADLCPNIIRVRIRVLIAHTLDKIVCGTIRRMKSLRVLNSLGVTLDTDMISHLSDGLALKYLSLSLNPSAPNLISSSTSVFPNLRFLGMKSSLLEPVVGLLSSIQLPVIEGLYIDFSAIPSKEAFRSYVTTVRNACPSNSLSRLVAHGTGNLRPSYGLSAHPLTLDDLRPCMTYVNLRSMDINLPRWSIELTDSDLLALVSTWPHVQSLSINGESGWRTTRGITLRGLSQVLQARRSLSYLCIAICAESYTELLHAHDTGSPPPPKPLTLNLADSLIRKPEDDVPGLADAFRKLGLQACFFLAWDGMDMENQEDEMLYHHQKSVWGRVFDRVSGQGVSTTDV